jgi:hypothetical protein
MPQPVLLLSPPGHAQIDTVGHDGGFLSEVHDFFTHFRAFFEAIISSNSLSCKFLFVFQEALINEDFFGNASGVERFERIYNRFFRMAVQKSLKSFFTEYNLITVRKLFHDKADVERTN